MKKPVIFLIASLAFVVGGGVLAFLYMATPKTDPATDTSAVAATVEQKCTAEVKKLWNTTSKVAVQTCVNAYNIETKTKAGANDYCSNQTKNSTFNATQMASICGIGQRLAQAAKSSASTASQSTSTSRSPGPSTPTVATSPVSNTTTVGPKTAQKTQSTAEVKDPPEETTCRDGKGVKLGTSGLLEGSKKCIGSSTQNPIYELIQVVSRYLIGLLGLVFVFMIVIAGFQYIISHGNSDDVKAAKDRLEHAVTGVVLLFLMAAILNALIPGGIL